MFVEKRSAASAVGFDYRDFDRLHFLLPANLDGVRRRKYILEKCRVLHIDDAAEFRDSEDVQWIFAEFEPAGVEMELKSRNLQLN